MLAHHCYSVRIVNKRVSMLQILGEREVCISGQEVTFNQQVFDLRHIPLIMKATGHNIVHKCQHLCNRNRMLDNDLVTKPVFCSIRNSLLLQHLIKRCNRNLLLFISHCLRPPFCSYCAFVLCAKSVRSHSPASRPIFLHR